MMYWLGFTIASWCRRNPFISGVIWSAVFVGLSGTVLAYGWGYRVYRYPALGHLAHHTPQAQARPVPPYEGDVKTQTTGHGALLPVPGAKR